MSESTQTLLLALGCIIGVFILFSILKGIIRLILFAIAITASIAVWIFVQKNGFTLLAFITDSPSPTLVNIASLVCALTLFVAFYVAMNWLGQLITLKGGRNVTIAGLITAVLTLVLMLWVATIGISYYGDIARINFYHELASAQMNGQETPSTPWSTTLKKYINESAVTSWLRVMDPLEDPAQANMACLVAYGCTMDEARYTAFYREYLHNSGIKHPSRFLTLFADEGLRTLVRERRFVSLMENEHLRSIIQDPENEKILRTIFD